VSMEGTSIEWYFDDLLLGNHLFPLTIFAAFICLDSLALSVTSVTVLLDLLIHARPHLIHLDHSTLAFTRFASFHLRPSLTATSLAASDTLVRDFYEFSVVALLESDFKGTFDRLSLGFLRWAASLTSSSTAEEHIEKVSTKIIPT
jgi:hypothetical protein